MPTNNLVSKLSRRQALAGGAAFAALTAAPVQLAAAGPGPVERCFHQWRAAADALEATARGDKVADDLSGECPPELYGECPWADGSGRTFRGVLMEEHIRERFAGAERRRLLKLRRDWHDRLVAARANPLASAAQDAYDEADDETIRLLGELLATPAASSRELAFKALAIGLECEDHNSLPCRCEDGFASLRADAERILGGGALRQAQDGAA